MSKNKNMKLESGQSNLSHVILSGREGSMDSSANAFRMTGEGGRSMVEMLGVLAIIGVLSVGGIAGYTMAMNKYKANEILQGASMRAMVVSAQLQRNSNATPNIGEFTGDKPAGATFGGPTVSGDKKTFTFTVSDVAPAVCDQMKAVVPDNSQNPVINCEANPITMTYNADLGSGTGSGEGGAVECTAGEKEVEYGGSKHCVKIIGSNLTHPEAYNACVEAGMSLMTKDNFLAVMGSDCSDVGGSYECNTTKFSEKIGWNNNFLRLADCYSDCPSNLGNESDTSGLAWNVDRDGIVGYTSRDEGYYAALCVR